MSKKLTKVTTDEIKNFLLENNGWSFQNDSLIKRVETEGWRSTMMLANTISGLCEMAWHHPKLELEFGKLTISLWTHEVGGISARDFELAKKIGDVLAWDPSELQNSFLTGLPADNRLFKKIR